MNLIKIIRQEKMWYSLYLFSLLSDCFANIWIANLLKKITDTILAADATKILTLFFEALCLLFFFIIISILSFVAEAKYKKNISSKYRKTVFQALIQKDIHCFEKGKTSQYLSGLTNDLQTIEEKYMLNSAAILQTIFMAVGAFILMIHYSFTLTMAAIIMLLIPIIISVLFSSKIAVQESNISKANSILVKKISNYLQGIQVIKSFQSENEVVTLFNSANQSTETEKYNRRLILGRIQTLSSAGGFITQIGVFLFGAYLSITQKNVTAGILLAFVNLMGTVVSPISKIPVLIANRKGALSLIKKMQNEIAPPNKGIVESIDKHSICWPIQFDHVTFNYSDIQETLSDISLQFEKGKKYAIVGYSGSGKSTLLELLLGIITPNSGNISFGCKSSNTLSSKVLLDNAAYIQQNVFLFDGTLVENITMYKSYDNKEVLDAIRKSGLEDFYKLHGSDYILNPEDENLSGGEKQRISIARAILKKSELIVGDEITSSLDKTTSESIFATLTQIPNVTKVIVTHNLDEDILKLFDTIVVLKDGKIKESGDYHSLMDKKGYLYSMKTIN
ncbi:MAG: ABC transporter ATP-binding protein/permease [Acetatifactor sp.]|nr:ABC transporter ATP-binding protein/permease [Acetatifactor sp.]